MYATGEQTDRQTDGRTKATLIAPLPTVVGIISLTFQYISKPGVFVTLDATGINK